METLPFTRFGFELYDEPELLNPLKDAGFEVLQSKQKNEEIQSHAGFKVSRDYYVVSAIRS